MFDTLKLTSLILSVMMVVSGMRVVELGKGRIR